MTNPSSTEARDDSRDGSRTNEASGAAVGHATGGEDAGNAAWEAPWIATPQHPGGAADQRPPPQTATGHYGPGYLDPTRHYGDTIPGQPGSGAAPESVRGEGGAIAGEAPEPGEVASPDACPTPAAPAIESPAGRR